MLRGIWEFPNFLNSIKRNTTTPNKGARHFPTISSIPSSLSRSCIFIHPPLQGVKKFGNFSLDIGRKNMWLVVLPYPFCTFFGNHLSLSLSVYKFVYALYGPFSLVSFFVSAPRFAKKLSHTTAVHFECLQHFLLRHDRQLREEVVITDSCHGCTILPCLSSELGPVALWWSNKNREHQIALQHLWTFLEWSLSHLTWWKPSWIRKVSPHFSWPCLQTLDIMAS